MTYDNNAPPMRNHKVMIASKVRHLTIIAYNQWVQEYRRIQQLRKEDWSLSAAGQWPWLLKALLIIISQVTLWWIGAHYVLEAQYQNWQQVEQHSQQLAEQWQALSQYQQDESIEYAQTLSTANNPTSKNINHSLETSELPSITAAQVPEWTQQLDTHFKQARVNLTAFSLAQPQPYADWQAQPFQLQLTGQYNDLAQSLGILSAITPLLTWHDFTLQQAHPTSEQQTSQPHPTLNMTINGRLLLTSKEKAADQQHKNLFPPKHQNGMP